MVDAILAGDIDVGPLDSYALDLMLRHEPDLAEQIRIVATTDSAPIPFLVASPECPEEVVAALRAALAKFGDVRRAAFSGNGSVCRFRAGRDRGLRSDAALGRRSARRGISASRLTASSIYSRCFVSQTR